jgi:putative ABC transport system ATP-binding protein
MSREAAVSAREITFRFDSARVAAPALNAVSVEIAAGEFVVLTGPSGSGKTTLLTLIGALRRPQQGSVRTLGHDLGGMNEAALARVRRDIGFIFQDHNLFDALTARETLALAMRLHSGRYGDADYREKPARLLARFGLGDHLDALPGRLSTGERQRVAIARALINEPRLILADEPTASLDASSAGVALDILAQAVREIGASVVMVSHDSRHHARSDRVVTLVDGCIVDDLRPGAH